MQGREGDDDRDSAPMTSGARPVARHWQALDDGRIRCGLCPHSCIMAEGHGGRCGIRTNEGGAMALPFYGRLSALAVDPIEKKPLHHFLPGTAVLSAGFFGCNLRCPFCQNWSISQERDPEASLVPPAAMVEAAVKGGYPSVAFTYSEPSIHFEYLLEASRLAHEAGLATVLVTNGCLDEGPAEELLSVIDAANVDLKCWNEAAYRDTLGGELSAVLRFLELASQDCHLEVTTLVVPGLSDSAEDIAGIASFLRGLDGDIPLHLSAYHPAWHYREAPTRARLLEDLAERAREYLRYVYVGNIAGLDSDSRCPSCGELLVRRRGYDIEVRGLEAGPAPKAAARPEPGQGTGAFRGRPGHCRNCGTALPFVLP